MIWSQRRAARLHEEGLRLSGDGQDDAAMGAYLKALALDAQRSDTLYNLGLIHKYRGEWAASLDYNRWAVDLAPGDQAASWNLAIAATALRDWPTARRVWRGLGMDVGDGEGPIDVDFGLALTRLNPDDNAEVVWIRRLGPVCGRIVNVPLPSSGYYFGDVILHDGAVLGEREAGGETYPIFNAFQRMERSAFGASTVTLQAPSEPDLAELLDLAEQAGMHAEDWGSSLRYLCKACSEGLAHGPDDHDPVWNPTCEVGFAVTDVHGLERLLGDWERAPGRRVDTVNHG